MKVKFQVIPAILLLIASLLSVSASEEPMYNVKVDGQALDLHDFAQGAFGQFTVAKPMEVEIRTGFDARWVAVRPLRSGIKARIEKDHRTVRFRIDRPQPLTVEFNGAIQEVLHLFADKPEENAPTKGDLGLHYFGPGLHEAGVIDLKDGETLYLAQGAWVRGCVRSIDSKNVRICGRGILDGSELDALRASATVPGENEQMPSYGGWNYNTVYLQNATGAKVEGITIYDSRHWTINARSCRFLHIDGVRILNPSVNYGGDGIDLDSSSDVLVENVFVRTNDDCIAVKNLDDVETRNIHVSNCVLWKAIGGNALEVGFEMRNARTSGLLFENIDIIHVKHGAAISIHNGDAATVENVTFRDIRVEDAQHKLFDFCVLYAQYGLDKAPTREERNRRMDRGGLWDGAQSFTEAERKDRAKFRGRLRNIRIEGLAVVDGGLPYSIVSGFDADHQVDGVLIQGLSFLGHPLRTAQEAKLVTDEASGVKFR